MLKGGENMWTASEIGHMSAGLGENKRYQGDLKRRAIKLQRQHREHCRTLMRYRGKEPMSERKMGKKEELEKESAILIRSRVRCHKL